MILTLFLFVSLTMGIPVPVDFPQDLLGKPQDPSLVRIISDERTFDPSRGHYSYDLEQSDGQRKSEQGEIRNLGTDKETLVVKGKFSYIGPDGKRYMVKYIADKNGFRPEGKHLPPAASVKRRPDLKISQSAIAAITGGALGK